MLRKIIAAALVSVMLAPSAFAGWAYSDNGLHWRNWANPNSLQPGEVYFDQQPTAAQLQAAFPAYAAAVAAQQAQATASTLQDGGFTISCASGATVCTSAIAGTYAVDQTHDFFIVSEASSILQNGTFTNGQVAKPWPDINGAVHTFSVAQWKEFDTAVASFIDGVEAAVGVAKSGGSPSWPPASAQLQ